MAIDKVEEAARLGHHQIRSYLDLLGPKPHGLEVDLNQVDGVVECDPAHEDVL